MYIFKWIAAVAIIFGFVIFNVGFVNPKQDSFKIDLKDRTSIISQTTTTPNTEPPTKHQPETPTRLQSVSNAINYYTCTNSDGNKTYQDRPCAKNELEVIFKEKTNSTIELQPKQNGNYIVSGTINNHPVEFIIDTGASLLALSKQDAAIYGVTGCTPSIATTANGTINTCIATAAQITIGKFQLNNITVSILPNLIGNPLLGMNVLKQLRIEQTSNQMRLSKE